MPPREHSVRSWRGVCGLFDPLSNARTLVAVHPNLRGRCLQGTVGRSVPVLTPWLAAPSGSSHISLPGWCAVALRSVTVGLARRLLQLSPCIGLASRLGAAAHD